MSLLVELLYEKNISTISTSVVTVLMAFLLCNYTQQILQLMKVIRKVQNITLHEAISSTMIILLLNIATFFVAI